MFCNKCGAQNAADAQFCSRCGAAFAPAGSSYSGAVIATPYAPVRVAGQYAGFWIRFLAFVIDFFVVGIVVFPVSAVIMVVTGGIARTMGGDVPFRAFWVLGVFVRAVFNTIVNWIYEAALESSSKQATLGKMALGLKVTDVYGNRISFARATGRHFAKYLSGIILGIGYIMIAFSERKQGLHDMIAGTLVVRS